MEGDGRSTPKVLLSGAWPLLAAGGRASRQEHFSLWRRSLAGSDATQTGRPAMSLHPATLDAMRSHNREVIISLLEAAGPLSRAELAKRSNLSRTTVTHVVRELIAADLITEVGDTVSTGGRPGILLRLNSNGWYAVGAELHSREWVLVVVNLEGTVIRSYERPVGSGSPEEALAALVEGIAAIWDDPPGRLLPAVGVGVPGTVDVKAGVVRHRSDDARWREVSVCRAIEDRFALKPLVFNRHKASGLAEARYGAGARLSELIYVGVGTGISAAVFSGGKPIDGASYSAGEIGHMVVLPDGDPCSCGNRGCLQTLASGPAMVRYVAENVRRGRASSLAYAPDQGQTVTGEAICAAARAGDALALEAVHRAAHYLGIALFNLSKVTNPQAIVVGGSIGLTGEPFLSLVREQVHAHERHTLEHVPILGAALGRQAGAIGAATLVLSRKLSMIEYREPRQAASEEEP